MSQNQQLDREGLTSGARSVRQDIDDELAFHIELARREFEAKGNDVEGALAAAHLQFGNYQEVRSVCLNIAWKERIMEKVFSPVVTIVLFVVAAGLSAAFLFQAHANTRMVLTAQEAAKLAEANAVAAQEREELAKQFLVEGIASQDPPSVNEIAVSDVLSTASEKIDQEFANDPKVLAKIKKVIEEARSEVQKKTATGKSKKVDRSGE